MKLIYLIAFTLCILSNAAAEDFWEIKELEDNENPIYGLTTGPYDLLVAGTLGSGMYRSVDNGMFWEKANDGLSTMIIMTLFRASDDKVYAGTYRNSIYYTDNRGSKWTQMQNGLDFGTSIESIVEGEDGTIYCGTTKRGVFALSPGTFTWTPLNEGFDDPPAIRALEFANDGSLLAGTKKDGLYLLSTASSSWTKIPNAAFDEETIETIAGDGGELFLGTARSGIFKSLDNGESWSRVNFETYFAVNKIMFNESGLMIAGSSNGIYFSADSGETWLQNNSGIPPEQSVIRDMTVDSDGYLWASSFKLIKSKKPLQSFKIVKSAAQSEETIKLLKNETFNIDVLTKDLGGEVIPRIDIKIYDFINGETVDAKTDLSGEFSYAASVPSDAEAKLYPIIIEPVADGYDFLLKDTVYVKPLELYMTVAPTETAEAEWKDTVSYTVKIFNEEQSGIENARVTVNDQCAVQELRYLTNENGELVYESIVPNQKPEGTYVVAFIPEIDGYDYLPIVYRNIEVSPVGDVSRDVAEIFSIKAYPNPASERITIEMALPRHSTMNLSLRDLAGKPIAEIADGVFPAGPATFELDAKSLLSGTYFMVFNINNQKFSYIIKIEK